MAAEMTAALTDSGVPLLFDAVTFVPMTKRERRRRGYNQSERLAAAVAARLSLPCEALLTKLFETRSQKQLTRLERSGNLLGVFDASASAANRRLLLVDDLVTTGSTLHECAKMLKIYGADSVTALTFAATVPTKK